MIMGLLSKLKPEEEVRSNGQHTAQIHAYQGVVYVEIMQKSNSEWFRVRKMDDFYHTLMHKTFGSMWRSAPREKDWIKANEWMNKQFDLLDKYSTVLITRPQRLYDMDELDKLNAKNK